MKFQAGCEAYKSPKKETKMPHTAKSWQQNDSNNNLKTESTKHNDKSKDKHFSVQGNKT